MRVLALLILATSSGAAAQAPDSTKIYRAARAAEVDYERAARRLAPFAQPERSRSCDEYVGRFCLYYDAGHDPLPAEPAEIRRMRERALAQLRNAFEIDHARKPTVLPLVRLLLENRQPEDAHAVVQAYRAAVGDEIDGMMLSVLTRHAAGDIPGAEAAIAELLGRVDGERAAELQDISYLLDRRERQLYQDLAPEQKRRYERRFWRYADALYLTEGNETRTEHFSRHAENLLLESAPWVPGGTSFDGDVAQLTIRFGTPKARSRININRPGNYDVQIVEHWDPEQMMYAPPVLDSVLTVRAGPEPAWPMDTVRTNSGHAPPTIRRMRPLPHQASVFREAGGGWTLRVDGLLPLDSVSRGAGHARQGLFLLDDTLAVIGAITEVAPIAADTLRFSLAAPLPAGALLYSAELLEPEHRLAGRARFRLDRPISDRGLVLSDVVISDPFPPGHLPASRADAGFRPKGSLVFPNDAGFGVYAEVSLGRPGPDSVQVELELVSIDGSPALVRAARWIGRRLGIADPPAPRKLTWMAEVPSALPAALAVTVEPGNLKPGRYILKLSVVSDERRATARREIVLTDAETS